MNNSNIYRRVAIFVLSAGLCHAIDPDRATSQYVRDHWGTEQGFPRGSVYAITQTKDGYLWIGSEAGLVRFDGLRFTLMRDPSGLSVVGLAPDSDGNLWARLRDMALVRFNNGSFERPIVEGNSIVTSLSQGRDGRLLAARRQLGAFTYRSGRNLEMVAAANGIPRTPITAITQTGNGDFWLGSRGSGLFRLSGGNTEAIINGLPDPKINCLLPDGNASMWIGTDKGVARWTGSAVSVEAIPAELRRSQILAIIKDRDSNLWVGTDTGRLLRYNAHGVAALDPGKGDPGAITAIFEDREGNLWAGSANGLERIRDSAFVTYSAPEGLPTDGGKPIFVDAANRLWFAQQDGGLWSFKDGSPGRIHNDGLDTDIVYSIAGGDGDLWLGRQRGGLTRLTSTRGVWQAKTYSIADGLAQNSVYSVYRTRSGAVWAGTLSGGVSRLDNGVFSTYTMADGLASNTVASILETADGTTWFATLGGLTSLSKGHWRSFTTSDGLPSLNVNCLLQDSHGAVWAGTTTGLAFFNGRRFVVPPHLPAPLFEQILGMVEDRFGWLWLSTSNHVLRVRRDNLFKGELTEIDVREYGLADGLRGVEGVKRHQSVVGDSAGRIWLSMNYGISVVDPARLTASAAPPAVQIQTLSADGETLSSTGKLSVPAGSQRLVFSFAGLSLSVPERVRFRYLLERYDRDWSKPVSDRQASYTNVGPGSYHFRVIASNPDGIWSNTEASLAFDVAPQYWQTWWFRGCVIAALALMTVALYRLRMRQLTSRLNLRFEERLAERTRIAQELHDTLLQGFLSASMQLHVATDRLPLDSPVRASFTRPLELIRQVIEEGRNAVRGLRSTPSPSLDLEHAFARIQEELQAPERSGTPVDFRVVAEGQPAALHPLVRDEVFAIGREALRNAFRHANAKQIEVEVNYSSSSLRVSVRDNGCGIDQQILSDGRAGHFGLSGMRERAERISAKLRLWSSHGTGTEIELIVPGNIAYGDRTAKDQARNTLTENIG